MKTDLSGNGESANNPSGTLHASTEFAPNELGGGVKPEPKPSAQTSLTGRPVGRALDFELAVISAIRYKHYDDCWVNRPLTCEEIAELTKLIGEEIGARGCTKQNISRIEQVGLRKLRRNKELESCLQQVLGTGSWR